MSQSSSLERLLSKTQHLGSSQTGYIPQLIFLAGSIEHLVSCTAAELQCTTQRVLLWVPR